MADPLIKRVKQLEKKKNYKEIINLYELVISDTDPSNKLNIARCELNIARAYNKMGNHKEAEYYYQKSVDVEENGQARYEMCFCQFNQKKSLDGWMNYGCRWDINEMKVNKFHIDSKLLLHVQDWKTIINSRVMIVSEQGFGDEILFSRVLPHAIPLMKKVGYCAKPELLPLFKHNFPQMEYTTNAEFIKPEATDWIYRDYDIIMTIGDLFRAYVMEFKKTPPVNKIFSEFTDRIPVSRKSVAYVYKAGTQGDNGLLRSIPANTLKFLVPHGYKIFNFQMGDSLDYTENLYSGIENFMDSANLLEGLSHVITVDTAFAHLALSMGKPTLVLRNKFMDWRWKNDLYPKAKLLSINDPEFKDKVLQFLESAE
jgi:hypothetical protein